MLMDTNSQSSQEACSFFRSIFICFIKSNIAFQNGISRDNSWRFGSDRTVIRKIQFGFKPLECGALKMAY